jgi:hypothetical protein
LQVDGTFDGLFHRPTVLTDGKRRRQSRHLTEAQWVTAQAEIQRHPL